MKIGVGLPSTIPGVSGRVVIDWARQAEERGFSTLGTLDRLVYPNFEPLTTLAAAAAVTERIGLTTAVLLAPLRANGALLAKQAATVEQLSAGRLVLGLGVGGRADDFEASGLDFHRRGRQFDALLETVTRIWSGEARGFAGPIGPRPGRALPLLIGGNADASVRRVARYGVGWIAGGGGLEQFSATAGKVRAAWSSAGRAGSPRLAALAYYALGPEARQHADRYLEHYYAIAGPYAARVARAAIVSLDQARQVVGAFQEAGCDELILFPCLAELDQVERLADAVL